MSSASVRFGTKVYVCARYFLRPGKCFKYMDQRGEDAHQQGNQRQQRGHARSLEGGGDTPGNAERSAFSAHRLLARL